MVRYEHMHITRTYRAVDELFGRILDPRFPVIAANSCVWTTEISGVTVSGKTETGWGSTTAGDNGSEGTGGEWGNTTIGVNKSEEAGGERGNSGW